MTEPEGRTEDQTLGLRKPRRRGRIRWTRVMVAAGAAVGLLLLAMLALASGVVFGATRGMPSLTKLLGQTPDQTTVLYDTHGDLIAQLHAAINRVNVRSDQIPTAMKHATVAIEDKRFYHHHGVDVQGILRAAVADLSAGRIVEGASTIDEQLIKNIYIGHTGRFALKIQEAVLAWQLEDRWSKDQILTAYLNTVYYGADAYGVEAAAKTYFHKDVWQLSLPECALLAGLPRDPSGYSPIYDPEDALARRNLVLEQMKQQGYISAAQMRAALKAPLGVYRQPPPALRGPAAYFVDYVTNQLVHRYGARETFEGGLRVITTLDLRMQNAAILALKSTLPPGPAGALVSIDPHNGDIRAMVASTDWRKTSFDLAWQSQRQLGSAMKPFALLAAVEQGANPATTYYNSMPLHIYLGPGSVPAYWNVSTFSHTYAGRINLVQATWQSDNTVYAQLAMDVGPQRIVDIAHSMGIVSRLRPYPSIVLGTEPVNPLEVADAYASLASEGVHHDPQAIEKVTFPDGRSQTFAAAGTRVAPAGATYVVDKVLEGNTRYGTAAAMPNYYTGVAAGKTGTTDNSADAWFCGFNTELATAVWMGYPQGELPMPGVQGATYCVPIWGKYYNLVFGDRQLPDFPQPSQMPVWTPWQGSHAVASPLASPSPSPSASPSNSRSPSARPTSSPAPSPTGTRTATPSPGQTPKPTTTPPKQMPTTKPTPAATPTGAASAPATAATPALGGVLRSFASTPTAVKATATPP